MPKPKQAGPSTQKARQKTKQEEPIYKYLMVRFGEDLLPIVPTTIIILLWSIFKVITVNRILENVEDFKSKFQMDLNLLLEKSGIDESEVKADRDQVSKKFDKSITLIKRIECLWRYFLYVHCLSVRSLL